MNAVLELDLLADVRGLKIGELEEIVGGLSKPSKMPGYAYSLPAAECATGSRLRKIQGSTCSGCYAMKGRYVFPNVQGALYRRLESLKDPRWAFAMAELIGRRTKAEDPYFRWHDSGDLQSLEHLELICQVCELTPWVRHWLPTREYRIVADYLKAHGTFPQNLNVRLSAHMVGGKAPMWEGRPVTVSTVSLDGMRDSHECPARFQQNQCGDCRACWDPEVRHVDYHLH